jgi:hypothetical protein
VNCPSGNAELLRKSDLCGTGLIQFDKVLSVDVKFYSGHVYDASSLSTLYIANSIISSNCRCWADPVIGDKFRKMAEKKGKKGRHISYATWYKRYVR